MWGRRLVLEPQAASLKQLFNISAPTSQLQQAIAGITKRPVTSEQDKPAQLPTFEDESRAEFLTSDEEVVNTTVGIEVESEVFYSSDDGEEGAGAPGSDGMFYTSDEGDGSGKIPRSYAHTRKPSCSARFLNKPVCSRALSRLLGIGSKTLQSLREGHAVYLGRPKRAKHPVFGFVIDQGKQMKWHSVVNFLYQLYHTSAEFLPTHYFGRKGAPLADEAPFPAESSDFSLRYLSKVLHDTSVQSSDLNSMLLGPGCPDAPRKYLQHSTRTSLYYEYVAFAESNGESAASLHVFLRVVNSVMKPKMRGAKLTFRKPGDHAQCNVCWELKTQIRQAKGSEARERAHAAFVKHCLSQWQDRQVYWQNRSQSQCFFTQVFLGEKLLDNIALIWDNALFGPSRLTFCSKLTRFSEVPGRLDHDQCVLPGPGRNGPGQIQNATS